MAEVMRNRGYNKKKLSIDLSVFDLTDFNNNNNIYNSYSSPKSTKSSPNRFESPKGVGILAALSSNNINNKSTVLAISPRLISSNPIPILSNSPKPINKNQQQPSIEEMEMCEEYTCVISHAAGSNLVRKREYFDDRFLGNGYHKATAAGAVVAASAPVEVFRAADFLNACSFCHKQLHGLDIFMYRGEKAFCSSDCRCKQISIDEHKEKCGSGAMKSPEFSASPCSQFSAGVAVA